MDTRPQLPFGSVLRASPPARRLKCVAAMRRGDLSAAARDRGASLRFNAAFWMRHLAYPAAVSKRAPASIFPQQLRGASPLDFSPFNISSHGSKRIKRTDGNARLSMTSFRRKKKKRKINPPLNIQLPASPLNNLFSHVPSWLTFI